jgi:hypothetical protein
MADKTLLRSQKNEVFRLIEPTGVDLARFTWGEVKSANLGDVLVSRLEYPDDFFFFFDRFANGKHVGTYSPGGQERAVTVIAEDWPAQLKNVQAWAGNLKREFAEPDLWTTISEERKLAEGASSGNDNSPFSPDERQRLAQDIHEIKEFLARTFALNQEQAKFVDDRLHYLTEASERLGRKDWINLTLSVLMTIIMGLAMPPDASRELLRFAGQVFNWVIANQLFFPI